MLSNRSDDPAFQQAQAASYVPGPKSWLLPLDRLDEPYWALMGFDLCGIRAVEFDGAVRVAFGDYLHPMPFYGVAERVAEGIRISGEWIKSILWPNPDPKTKKEKPWIAYKGAPELNSRIQTVTPWHDGQLLVTFNYSSDLVFIEPTADPKVWRWVRSVPLPGADALSVHSLLIEMDEPHVVRVIASDKVGENWRLMEFLFDAHFHSLRPGVQEYTLPDFTYGLERHPDGGLMTIMDRRAQTWVAGTQVGPDLGIYKGLKPWIMGDHLPVIDPCTGIRGSNIPYWGSGITNLFGGLLIASYGGSDADTPFGAGLSGRMLWVPPALSAS